MIELVVRAIKAALPECTAEQVADVLWLSGMIADAEERGENLAVPVPAATSRGDRSTDGAVDDEDEAEEPSDARVMPPDGGESVPVGPASAATMVGLRALDGAGRPAAAIRAMALFRRVHRPGRPVLDLDATVEATADARRLVVLTRAALDRGLDVAIVADRSPVTAIWSDAIDRFADSLRRTGAFRLVTRWTLEPAGPALRIRDANGDAHEPERLVDATGNRLVLVMTDAVADHWYAAPVWAALRRWGRVMPTSIVSLLPAEQWGFTATGRPSVTLRSRRPAGPNSSAETQAAWWSDDEASAGAVAIPVVGLRPEALEQWAQAVAAGGAWAEAVWAEPPQRTAGETNARLTAEDRVRAFQLRSSSEARELAAVLAGSPVLSVPLIRVLQHRLLGSTDPVPLSEIMVGGLLQAMPDGWIRFRPGVAEHLSHGMTISREWDTFEVLSEYLEQHAGSGAAVQALFLDPRGAARVDPRLEPFAAMGQQVAKKLGVALSPSDTTATGPAPAFAVARHRFAKVVVVGDSRAGKSTLLRALTELGPADVLDRREVRVAGDETEIRETYLSDFPDPDRFHLPNRSRLTDLVIAVVVVADGPTAHLMSAAQRWRAAVDQVKSDHAVAKVLVSNRLSGSATDLERSGFAEYVVTDAQRGTGVAELREAIQSAIDWGRAPYVKRSANATRIAGVVEECRRSGRLICTVLELVYLYRQRYGVEVAESEVEDFLRTERRIGRVARLRVPATWLFEPERLEQLADRMLLEARNVADGVGVLSEARITGVLADESVGSADPRALLEATVAELDAAGRVVRVSTDQGRMLAFTDVWPTGSRRPADLVESTRYTFTARNSAVRSGIAARIAYSSAFGLERIYRRGAAFRGPSRGVCGFDMTEDDHGLTAFFSTDATVADRAVFLGLIEAQLADQLGKDAITKTRIEPASPVSRPRASNPRYGPALLQQSAGQLREVRRQLTGLIAPAVRGWAPLQAAMADAVGDPPRGIADVLAIQVTVQAILDQLPSGPGSNRVAAFNKLLLTITRRVDTALQTDAESPEFLELLNVEFAKRYFVALDRWNRDEDETPNAWEVLFRRAGDLDLTQLTAAILGVNAHLNYDLPLALVSTWEQLGPPLDDRIPPDYLLLNKIFYEEIPQLRRGFNDSWQMEIDRLVGPLDDDSRRMMVRVARAEAWDLARRLWLVRDDAEDFELTCAVMDECTALLGEWLLFGDRLVNDAGEVVTGGLTFLRRLG